MKTFHLLIILVVLATCTAPAQFKSEAEQPSVARSLVSPAPSLNSFLGFLNPENFNMRHNVSLSYMSLGGTSMSLASYTNSMFYKIADPLNVRFDVTLQGSPYMQSPNQSAFNGVFLSRAELNYRPWENCFIKVEYNRLPIGYYGLSRLWYNPASFMFDPAGE
jgi:hypothetical protein